MQLNNNIRSSRDRALDLRKKGYLLTEISSELGIAISTLHGWLKGEQFSVAEMKVIDNRLWKIKQSQYQVMNKARQIKRIEREAHIVHQAEATINEIKLSKVHRQLLCAVFFWCEGGKDISSGWQFINSDPIMVKTFLTLLRTSFEVDESKFRALVHLHDYHDVELQQDYWSEITQISRAQFHKPFLKMHTGKQKRIAYPGCISIRYLDKSFGLLLKMLYTNFGKTI